jgi:hypothetical protein
MWQAHEHDIAARGRFGGSQILEPEIGPPRQRQVNRAQRLTDVIDAGHTRQFNLGMDQ